MPQPEPALILGMIPLPSPTVAGRFVETGMTANEVRDLLVQGSFLRGEAVVVTAHKSSRLYMPDVPWQTVKEIMRKDQYV